MSLNFNKNRIQKKINKNDNSSNSKERVKLKLNIQQIDNWAQQKQTFNELVLNENKSELNSKIFNPLTNRMIKKYTVFNRDGTFKDAFKNKLGIVDGSLAKRENIIIAVNTDNKETLKFNKETVGDTFLSTEFGEIVNKNNLKIGNMIGDYILTDSIKSEEKTLLTIQIEVSITFSTTSSKPFTTNLKYIDLYSPSQLVLNTENIEFWKTIIKEDYASALTIDIKKITALTSQNNAALQLIDMELRHSIPLDINYIFNEKIINKNYKHCIHDFMIDRYKNNYPHSEIKRLKTTRDIYLFCVKYNIKLRAFNYNKEVICSHDPPKKNKIKPMIYIAYNSHLYALKSEFLNKMNNTYKSVKVVEDITPLIEISLTNNIIPKELDHNGDYFTQFISNGILYIENPEYDKCLEILKKFGLQDKIHNKIKVGDLGNIIEKLYCKNINSHSFYPYGSEFNKQAFNYHNENLQISDDNLITIDGVKFYPSQLLKLPFLIRVDIKYHKHRKFINEDFFKNNEIVPHYIYAVKVKNSNVILTNNDFYIGTTLIYAQTMNLEFTILEELETEKVPNYFKEMIHDIFKKCSESEFKSILNILIGQFECNNYSDNGNTMVREKLKFNRILDISEVKTFDGQIKDFKCGASGKEFKLGFDLENNFNIFNRKPIAFQIKDLSRIILHKQIVKMGLDSTNIKQIKTDSITFDKSACDYIDKYIFNKFSGWKYETYSAYNPNKTMQKSTPTFDYKTNTIGHIELGYAGCGKTHKIINTVLPKFIKPSGGNNQVKQPNDYCVLSPSHASLIDYYNKEFISHPIQTYTFKSNKVPKETNIIVDEIGMVDNAGWNMLFRCFLLKKNIIVYGDLTQLKPVNGNICDNTNFHNLLFNKSTFNTDNYRNKFSNKFYDYLFNLKKRDKSIAEIVKKYNTDITKTDTIIAYYNETRIKYNKKLCFINNIKNLYDKNAKIICKTNELLFDKFYNNECLTVDNYNKKTELLKFTNGKELTISIYHIKKYFDYAYCKTLYNIQGSSINNFYFCEEDLEALGGREIYTLISRLKI